MRREHDLDRRFEEGPHALRDLLARHAWDELRVGSSSFTATGFAEASHPALRRVVMRIDL